MIYLFKCCKCGYKETHICKVKDKPDYLICKCGYMMNRDWKGEGTSFQLKGDAWAKNGYNFCNMEAERLNKEANKEREEYDRREKIFGPEPR